MVAETAPICCRSPKVTPKPSFTGLTWANGTLPILGEIAARLAGTDEIRLFDDQAVLKPPGDTGSVVGWPNSKTIRQRIVVN